MLDEERMMAGKPVVAAFLASTIPDYDAAGPQRKGIDGSVGYMNNELAALRPHSRGFAQR